MLANIQSLLTTIGLVLTELLGAVSDIVGFVTTQPILMIAIMLGVVGFAFSTVRGWIRQ